MGLDADEAQHDNPASQEDEAEQPRCDIEGGNNARGQVELVHNKAEDGSNDGPREQRPELQSSQCISPEAHQSTVQSIDSITGVPEQRVVLFLEIAEISQQGGLAEVVHDIK